MKDKDYLNLKDAVVVNVSEDWIHNVIVGEVIDKNADTFIIDEYGRLVSSSLSYPMMTDISGNDYVKDILNGTV